MALQRKLITLAPAPQVIVHPVSYSWFIPVSFKRAAITTVFKSGLKPSPIKYKPISFTYTIIKVFEWIVRHSWLPIRQS